MVSAAEKVGDLSVAGFTTPGSCLEPFTAEDAEKAEDFSWDVAG